MVDQHAAHERVRLETLSAGLYHAFRNTSVCVCVSLVDMVKFNVCLVLDLKFMGLMLGVVDITRYHVSCMIIWPQMVSSEHILFFLLLFS